MRISTVTETTSAKPAAVRNPTRTRDSTAGMMIFCTRSTGLISKAAAISMSRGSMLRTAEIVVIRIGHRQA